MEPSQGSVPLRKAVVQDLTGHHGQPEEDSPPCHSVGHVGGRRIGSPNRNQSQRNECQRGMWGESKCHKGVCVFFLFFFFDVPPALKLPPLYPLPLFFHIFAGFVVATLQCGGVFLRVACFVLKGSQANIHVGAVPPVLGQAPTSSVLFAQVGVSRYFFWGGPKTDTGFGLRPETGPEEPVPFNTSLCVK